MTYESFRPLWRRTPDADGVVALRSRGADAAPEGLANVLKNWLLTFNLAGTLRTRSTPVARSLQATLNYWNYVHRSAN